MIARQFGIAEMAEGYYQANEFFKKRKLSSKRLHDFLFLSKINSCFSLHARQTDWIPVLFSAMADNLYSNMYL